MGFVKVWLHLHDLGKCVLGVVQRTIPVVEDANAVPEPGFLSFTSVRMLVSNKMREVTNLWVWEVDEGSLVGVVGLLQVVHHQVAMSYPVPLANDQQTCNQRTNRDNPTRLRSFRPA